MSGAHALVLFSERVVASRVHLGLHQVQLIQLLRYLDTCWILHELVEKLFSLVKTAKSILLQV